MTDAAAARRLARHARAIETALRRIARRRRGRLAEAERYALLGGGKRIRPLLALATGDLGRPSQAGLLATACAIEMVHTYSLVHDDLPAMDDDELRRGRPTTHRVYGEGLAILVGDALLTEAFGVLAGAAGLGPAKRVALVAELANAAGPGGMVGGQALDLAAAGAEVALAAVRDIHRKKTGALLRGAVRMGAIAAGVGTRTLARVTTYGERLGLAFQIVDDVLDAAGDPASDGRTDLAFDKATYPALIGLDRSRREATRAADAALAAIAPLGPRAAPLRLLVRRVTDRLAGDA